MATATGLTSAARMSVLAGRAALVMGGSRGIDRRIRGAPDPDGAAVCSAWSATGSAEQVAVETPGGWPSAVTLWRGQGQWLSGGRNSLNGMSVDLLGRPDEP